MDLQNTINEVHRKIGRNLLLIQKIEYRLKYIILHSKISGQPSQLKDIKKTNEEKLSKKSMGHVLSQYINHINPLIESNQENPNYESDSYHFSYEIDFNLSKEEFEKKENLLSDILKERNDLVHHFILEFNESSINSCKDIEHKLDEQENRFLLALKDLQLHAEAIKQVHNHNKKNNEKITKHFVLLNHQLLILELAKISIQNDKLDGWTSLGFAGRKIRNIIPEEVDKLNEKYGYKTLKALLENTEIFEIKEDSTKNMVFYKLRADWEEYLRQFY